MTSRESLDGMQDDGPPDSEPPDDGEIETGTGAPPAADPYTSPAPNGSFALVGSSHTLARIFGALAKAQGKILPAKKDTSNPHFESVYADLAAVVEAARPHLSECGLCVLQVPTVDAKGNLVLATILGHESGEFIVAYWPIRPMRQVKDRGWVESHDPQSMGSAVSYGRRYCYQGVTGVVAVREDEDGNAATGHDRIPKGPKPEEMPCPKCGVIGSIIPSKFGEDGRPCAPGEGGFVCWKGASPPRATGPGCGATFAIDPRIEVAEAKRAELGSQGPQVGGIVRDDDTPANAAKRAELRAAMSAPPSSERPQPSAQQTKEQSIAPYLSRLEQADTLATFDAEAEKIRAEVSGFPEAARALLSRRAGVLRRTLVAVEAMASPPVSDDGVKETIVEPEPDERRDDEPPVAPQTSAEDGTQDERDGRKLVEVLKAARTATLAIRLWDKLQAQKSFKSATKGAREIAAQTAAGIISHLKDEQAGKGG